MCRCDLRPRGYANASLNCTNPSFARCSCSREAYNPILRGVQMEFGRQESEKFRAGKKIAAGARKSRCIGVPLRLVRRCGQLLSGFLRFPICVEPTADSTAQGSQANRESLPP